MLTVRLAFLALAAFLAAQNPTFSPTVSLEKTAIFSAADDPILQKIIAAQTPPTAEKIYCQLDRPLFEPGDDLWFSLFVRDAATLAPSPASQIAYAQLLGPRGDVLAEKRLLAIGGWAGGDFRFDENWPGGQYRLRAFTRFCRDTFSRSITVQKTVAPRLLMKLDFETKSVGPGGTAIARFEAQSLDNQPIANRQISYVASVDGQEFLVAGAKTDATGRAFLKFEMLKKLNSTDGVLNVLIEKDGQMESISRPIPIVLNRIDLQFFPEGGDRAPAFFGQKIAFKAVNEFGKPADVAGGIFNQKGERVAHFSSLHDGMGATVLIEKCTIEKGLFARIEKPFLDEKTIALPDPNFEKTLFFTTIQDGELGDGNLEARVFSTVSQKAFLIAFSRDKPLIINELSLEKGQSKTSLFDLRKIPPGIIRLALFDEKGEQQAERLVFAGLENGLQISIKTDREKYLPRQKVQLEIEAKNSLGQPVEGQFSLAVADDAHLTFADDKQGNLLAEMLLEQDVRGAIHEPNFYFDSKEEKAPAALDVLLLTQGWRRILPKKAAAESDRAGEKATVAGRVVRPKSGLGWRSREVQLWPAGPKTLSLAEGRFSFENVDLRAFTHLKFGEHDFFPLTDYGQNFELRARPQASRGFWTMPPEPSENPEKAAVFGQVIDHEAGEPLIGASVVLLEKGRSVGAATTDIDGNFRIDAPAAGRFLVQVSYTGYGSKNAEIELFQGKKTFLGADLGATAVLEEVVVTAFRTPILQKESSSAVRVLTADEIRKAPTKPSAKAAQKAAPHDVEKMVVDEKRMIRADRAQSNSVLQEVVVMKVGAAKAEKDDWEGAKQRVVFDKMEEKQAKKYAPAAKPRPLPGPAPRTGLPNLAVERAFFVPKYAADQAAERSDFRKTIFWQSKVMTDKMGRASVDFFPSDELTSFRATVEGFGDLKNGDWLAGQAEHRFFTQKSVELAVKMPTQVLAGDVVELSVSVKNNSEKAVAATLEADLPTSAKTEKALPATINLAAGEARTFPLKFQIDHVQSVENQQVAIKLTSASGFSDAISQPLKLMPRGFPVSLVFAGKEAQAAFSVPLREVVEGTMTAKLTAYPSALDELGATFSRMLRQPGGCFEQTSSSNYPNILVLDFLRKTGQSKPEIEQQAAAFLADGYKRLTAYESKSGGFDWWGRDPAHEGLTAMGLLQFEDMKSVFEVDNSLIMRTLDWLMARRDGRGGWNFNPNCLHSWSGGGPLNAYICWAIAEAGHGRAIKMEIEKSTEYALLAEDFYQIALLANARQAAGLEADFLIKKLLDGQKPDGSWDGKTGSVTASTGQNLTVETTALAAMACSKTGISEDGKADRRAEKAGEKAILFLTKSKNEYGFGSTQATVLALRALKIFTEKSLESTGDGKLVVQIDGERVVEQAFSAQQLSKIEITGLERFFKSPEPRVEVFFEGKSKPLPFDFEVNYSTRRPRNAAGAAVSIQSVLAKTAVKMGETVRFSTVLRNETDRELASPMLVVGIPGGATLPIWQLKKLVEAKKCAFYELWDGAAVFHFERLAAGSELRIDLDLKAEIAGRWEAPPSQGFLYYSNDERVWAKPAVLEIGF